jgi:hypothetical protein
MGESEVIARREMKVSGQVKAPKALTPAKMLSLHIR